MKAVMLMFDSLNKKMLSSYGDNKTITPNFERLKDKSLIYDNFYVGSLPCMPARRELHTGRYNFLHRGWSPLEPFDESMPELLKNNGIHTHLVTDHKHYWRDGGATYHSRYNTYDFIRGQEGDSWIGQVEKPEYIFTSPEPETRQKKKKGSRVQDIINRKTMINETDYPLAKTVNKGLEFIERNKDSDNWFLQIECFDPHEPFTVPKKYLDMYGIGDVDFDGWPTYYLLTEDCEKQEIIQKYYRALVTMCDDYLGKVLDKMDEEDMWDDTMFILNTDHGFLLGEHEWWGKNIMPVYNEIANTPFYIWDPRFKKCGERREALAQTIDIPATLLDYFDLNKPKEMLGKSLAPTIENDTKIRDYGIFGYIGSHLNITDGQYVYMRSPKDKTFNGVYEYTLMPTRINRRFTPKEFDGVELVEGFDFTKGCKLLKFPLKESPAKNAHRFGNRLYDLIDDPNQKETIQDFNIEQKMVSEIINILMENDAPKELYERLGLSISEKVSISKLEREYISYKKQDSIGISQVKWNSQSTQEGFLSFLSFFNEKESVKNRFKEKYLDKEISSEDLFKFIQETAPQEKLNEIFYHVNLNMRTH